MTTHERIAKSLHVLKSPLTIIREGISIVLDESAGPINKEQKDFLETAKKQSDRLGAMMQDVFEYHLLCSHDICLKKEECDIRVLITEGIAEAHSALEAAQLTCSYNNAPSLSLMIDKYYIGRAFSALLYNAIQYTEHYGSITVALAVSPSHAIISVSDTGLGIPESQRALVIEPFIRFHKPLTMFGGGAGLGLARTKIIIEKHGGTLYIKDNETKGTTVLMHIPLPPYAPQTEG